MKIDFHSHIIPGIDDGATDTDNAVELVRAMKDWGFEKITCTPHINALYPNTPSDIERGYDALLSALEDGHVDIRLAMSAEYRLVPETWPEVLEKNWIMPIEDSYILTELPISKPEEMGYIKPLEEFRKLIAMGLTPILPHPERYFYLSHRELMKFIEEGVVIQCNYGSLAGLYGAAVQERTRELVKEGVVTLYGTDMHNLKYVDIIGRWFAEGNQIAEF
jgi:tyrosine-protein phosphatase YwqE